MCLVAVIDWHGRRIVGRRLSDTMRAREAFARRGTPGAMSSGQGSAFGSDEHVSLLAGPGIPQGTDGRARWADNVGIERQFRALKGETPTSWCCGGFLVAAKATGFGWIRISCQIRAATLRLRFLRAGAPSRLRTASPSSCAGRAAPTALLPLAEAVLFSKVLPRHPYAMPARTK